MAEREVIVVDPGALARDQLVKDLKAYEKNPIDRSAKPNGYFLNADGSGAHDSEGRPVELLPRDKAHAEELSRMTRARFQNQQEAEGFDSPEEVAEREVTPVRAGPWTPPAVEPGTVMGQDGSVSAPDESKKKSAKKSSRKGR